MTRFSFLSVRTTILRTKLMNDRYALWQLHETVLGKTLQTFQFKTLVFANLHSQSLLRPASKVDKGEPQFTKIKNVYRNVHVHWIQNCLLLIPQYLLLFHGKDKITFRAISCMIRWNNSVNGQKLLNEVNYCWCYI